MFWNHFGVHIHSDICLGTRKQLIGKWCRADNNSFISVSIPTGHLYWVYSFLHILKLNISNTSKTYRHKYSFPYWSKCSSIYGYYSRYLLLAWFSSHDSFLSISSSLPLYKFPTSLNISKSARRTYPLI